MGGMTLARVLGLAAALATSFHESALAQAASRPESAPVYRCPGPPVLYVDDISASEAKRRGCRTLEGAEIVLPVAPQKQTTKTAAQKATLNRPQQLAYDDCRIRAAQAPTTLGVQTGLKVCDEKFGQ